MTSRRSTRSLVSSYATGALTVLAAVALAACSSAAPPKPPPPPIEGLSGVGSPAALPSTVARAPGAPPAAPNPPGAPGANPPIAASKPGPTVLPTVPAIVASAAAAAPAPPGAAEDDALPTGAQVAQGVIAALAKARTAHLSAKLPTGHTTDLEYVAPDRAGLVEQDVNGQEAARYVIIGDTGYYNDTRAGGGWRKVVNEGYRKQAQIFRPIQIALATGQARTLESGGEVERVEENGKPALSAVFEYGDSPELQDLGLMRSSGNLLYVVVDPTTWLPIRTREETTTGGPDKSVTEVHFLAFDVPTTVDAPIP